MKRDNRSRDENSRLVCRGSCAFGAFADPSPKAAPASPAQLSTLPQGEGWAFVATPQRTRRGRDRHEAGCFGEGSANVPKAQKRSLRGLPPPTRYDSNLGNDGLVA